MGAAFFSQAQTKIGDAAGKADANAYLQLGEATGSAKGLLHSRIALTSTTSFAPMTAHVAGMMVYNTTTANDVTPGFYYNDGTKWIRISGVGVVGSQPWYNSKTKNPSTANIDSVYVLGRAMIGIDTAVVVAADISGSTPMQQRAAFTVANGDASINGVTVGMGGAQNFRNTALGVGALYSNTTGTYNTAIGMSALKANTTGNWNMAVGPTVLSRNISGSNNNGLGINALVSNTSGTNNEALGVNAVRSNDAGHYNVGIGTNSLYSNTTGSHNIAIGYSSLYDLNIADNSNSFNTVVGDNSGGGIVTGLSNTILGANVKGLPTTLSNNIIIADGDGNQRINADANGNVGIGTATPAAKLEVFGGDAIINGITVGLGAGQGGRNVIVGNGATFAKNTAGTYTTAMGNGVLAENLTGIWNTAVGANGLSKNTTGSYNSAFGVNALQGNQSGSMNTAMGVYALKSSSGSKNTAIGYQAGQNQGTGDNNIMIGLGAAAPDLAGSNQISIGNLIYGTGVIGGGAGNIGIGSTAPTEKLDVNGAIKVANNGYTVSSGAMTPVPTGGEGTIVYSNHHLWVWTGNTAAGGTGWRQIDN